MAKNIDSSSLKAIGYQIVRRKVVLENDIGPVDVTHDEHILRNLNYANPRVRVEYGIIYAKD